MDDTWQALTRLWRRVQTTIGRGRVFAPSIESGGVQLLQVVLGPAQGGEVRDNTPRVAEFGFASSPASPDPGYGCDAVVLFVAGDRSNGVVIGTNDQRYRPTYLQPGEVVVYDARGQSIYLSKNGIVVSSPTKIRFAAPTIQIHATSELAFDCDGNGTVIKPSTRDDYVTGSTGTTHPLNPPEVPD